MISLRLVGQSFGVIAKVTEQIGLADYRQNMVNDGKTRMTPMRRVESEAISTRRDSASLGIGHRVISLRNYVPFWSPRIWHPVGTRDRKQGQSRIWNRNCMIWQQRTKNWKRLWLPLLKRFQKKISSRQQQRRWARSTNDSSVQLLDVRRLTRTKNGLK